MAGALTVLSMGVLLGLSHATDGDHVVAVSTIVARERRVGAAARIGALWGLGHSATVLLVGGAMVLSGVVLPERAAQALELLVALMLVALGLTGARRALAASRGGRAPAYPPHALEASRGWLRPVGVGVVHGLAGSAALALAVLATVRDRALATAYLGVFCVGTIVGMSVVTAMLSTPLALAARRLAPAGLHRVALAAGITSIAFGVWLGYRVGVVDGLLLGVAGATP
jgi:high-affinity nickel-transport protein